MKRTVKHTHVLALSTLILTIFSLASCGGGDTSTASDTSTAAKYSYARKAQSVAMEADLQADATLTLSTDRNVALFLGDPDAEVVTRNWTNLLEEKTRQAMKQVPLDIGAAGTYQLCNEHPELKEQRLHTLLTGADGNELLSVMDEGCKPIDLPAGRFHVQVGTVADEINESGEWPVFLSFDGQRIRVMFNGCPNCDLKGIDLRNRTLIGTDLNHANLENRLVSQTQLIHVIGDGSNLLTGRNFDEIAKDAFNRSASVAAHATKGPITRHWWNKAAHAVTHPVDTAKKVVHKGADVVHRVIEDVDSAEIKELIVVLGMDNKEVDTDSKLVFEHRWARSINAMTVKIVKPPLASVIDHTYVELDTYTNETMAFGAFGDNTGGKPLDETESHCDGNQKCIDVKTVSYMMLSKPCKWPAASGYGRVGVCWNLVNRGLYYTGQTVHKVPYWTIIESFFGTYGAEGSYGGIMWKDLTAPYTMSACLTAQQKNAPWEGQDFGVPRFGNPDNLRSVAISTATVPKIDPRVQLFNAYHGEENSNLRSSAGNNQDQAYLQELLKLNIQEKLGTLDAVALDAILAIHARYYPKIATLRGADSKTFSIKALNALMNEELAEYRQVLGDQRYMTLMGLTSMEPFDVEKHGRTSSQTTD